MDFVVVIILALFAAASPGVNSLPNTNGLSEVLTTKLRVSEHGANFNETITFDKTSHLVTFHVPKHRHLSEHITIMDNATQRSLTLLPEHSYCLLKEIPDFIDPEGTFHTFSAMEPLQPVATPEASEIRHIVDIDIGLATPEELAGLPYKMKELCKNLPVRRVHQVETSGDEEASDEAIRQYLNSKLHHVVKRQTAQTCDMTYITTRRSGSCSTCHYCLYAVCPLMLASSKCLNAGGRLLKHIDNVPIASVLCCEGSDATPLQCSCDYIQAHDVRTPEFGRRFKACQDKYMVQP